MTKRTKSNDRPHDAAERPHIAKRYPDADPDIVPYSRGSQCRCGETFAPRVLVCGSRHWDDTDAIHERLGELPDHTVILQGGAMGADRLAMGVANRRSLAVTTYYADWQRYGRAAGPKRNQRMLDHGQPDFVIAFHEDIRSSKGTLDMVRRARKAGVPVEIIAP